MSKGTTLSLNPWNQIEPHEDSEYYNRKFFGKNYDKEVECLKKHARKG